jgi:hypothetical protein
MTIATKHITTHKLMRAYAQRKIGSCKKQTTHIQRFLMRVSLSKERAPAVNHHPNKKNVCQTLSRHRMVSTRHRLCREEALGTGQDGNEYVPDGYWPPMPAPTRSKPIPLGYPLKQTGMEFIPYPHPTGNPRVFHTRQYNSSTPFTCTNITTLSKLNTITFSKCINSR